MRTPSDALSRSSPLRPDAADVILIGGGGHARVLADVLERLGRHVLGYVAPDQAGTALALPYLGTDGDLLRRRAGGGPGRGAAAAGTRSWAAAHAVLAIGKLRPDDRRLELLTALLHAGVEVESVVAPTATVQGGVEMGAGTAVLDGAIVAAGARLGRCCIVNHAAVVDHGCELGDDVHVAPGATVGGGTVVGSGSVVGAGATVIHGLRLAERVVVGAGATVVGDLTEAGTYLGTPARRA